MMYLEWSDSELDDREYPDEFDEDEPEHSDDTETLPCPECGESIYELTPSCPHCGCYVTFATSIWSGRSLLWVGLGLLGIVVVIASLTLAGM